MKSKAIFYAFIGLLLASNAQASDLELINKLEQSQKLAAHSWNEDKAEEDRHNEQIESEEAANSHKEKFYSKRDHAWF